MRNCTPFLPTAFLVLAFTSGIALADGQRTTAMLWGSALNGTLQVGPGAAEFHMSVEDILNVLDGSITLRHESAGETLGWYAELVYNDLKRETSGLSGERQANLQQTIFELGMTRPLAAEWDLYAGLRSEAVDNSIEFTALPTASSHADWIDVLAGFRWHRESDASRWWARGDLALGGSDGAYLVEAGGAWRFAEVWEVSLAYRMLNTELDSGTMLLDLEQGGLVIGVAREW